MQKLLRSVSLIAATSLMFSCASTTIIESVPSGAQIFADGSLLGTTPYTYSDTKIVGATTQIQLKKKGCKSTSVILSRSEAFQVGPCIGGALVLVPFLWVMGYNPQHTYTLDCGKNSSDDDSATSSIDSNVFRPELLAQNTAPQCPGF